MDVWCDTKRQQVNIRTEEEFGYRICFRSRGRKRLKWFVRVERKEDNDWLKAWQGMVVERVKGKGRGRLT